MGINQKILLLAMSIVTIASIGCATEKTERPTPPTIYMTLPRPGRTDCSLRPKSGVFVWDYPGLTPTVYDDSGYTPSITGRQKGLIPGCVLVDVLDFAWSEYDKTFYIYIKQNGLEGWALSKYVEVPYPP